MSRGNTSVPDAPSIPLQSGNVFVPSATQLEQWKTTYPDIDVRQELRQIQAWNQANPTERKTRSQILRHINAWLAKEQREYRNRQQAPPSQHPLTRLAVQGLSPTLAHNLVVGEQWLRHSRQTEEQSLTSERQEDAL